MLSVPVIKDSMSDATSDEAHWQSSIDQDHTISPATTSSTFSSPSNGSDPASSATTNTEDAHAVSEVEARFYYSGVHSGPTLLYRTGKKWSPPRAPETNLHLKEIRQVSNHPITKVWNHDLGWQVVKIMDTHMVS